MSFQLVIAEKPSVARSIAAVIGAAEKQTGYWQGGGYLVSWCIGHLVSFAEAGQYDEKYCKWRYEDLPILPQPWQFVVPDEKKQQFEVLRTLLNRSDVDSVTAATDAGREGELIFRFVYQMAGCTKPVKRLWISSMEDAAIREGFANLRPDSDYDALYQSALCRAKADWLVGINATRLFSVLYHKTLTVGRVQTPTLKMLVDRDAKILRFQKEKYYTVGIQSGSLKADSGRIADAETANSLKEKCTGAVAVCTSVKREKILAPAPYKVKQKMEKLDDQGKPILDKDGKPLTEEKTVQIPAFKVVSVFDVSQTEGEPLPSIAVNELSGSVQDYQDFFKALEQSSPVPIGFEDIEGGAHGYFHLLDNRIAIQEGMSQLQTIKTAIHEIAHAKLHAIDPTDPEQTNRPDSRTREVQAESVAYAVCQHYGLDTSEYSFGYVAGWSSGRELAELKASLEIIRSAAHELISALDEHLAELRQQRETELSTAQEAAFALDNGNTLFIQTCDSGYDYTLYGPDNKALDGGQLDAPGLTLPDAGEEALALLGQTVKVSEVLLGDKLTAFREAAEKANEIPAPVKIPDPAAEPTVTILWSESDKLQDGETMPLSMANRVFEELDTAQHTDREKDGYEGGWYDKTAFRIDFTLNGQPDNYEGRQDFGDGEGSLVQHIQNYHEYYAKDENWKNFVLHNKGPEAWEQDKAEREMVLTEFIPYLKQHCNLSAMEQTATTALREGQNILPEQTSYYTAVVAYVQDCRSMLNQGRYDLPEPPKLADFDQTLQDYKAQVQAEIAQEAAAAGMTVEEYAAAGFEAPQQDSFSIYQLRNEDSTRVYRFEPYDRLQAAGRTVDKANYMEVYAAPLAVGTTLEDIYRTFNVDHPADFRGHSLSVSDVVVLHQNGQDTAHYCDSVGFQQVPEFLRENPLRTAELSTEQNENMIDSVINNAPSMGELEAKVKAGEQISLTDLAAAVKAEKKAPKAKKSRAAKPKKPSIRAQLDAAKKEQRKQTQPREKSKELEV